MRVVTDFIYALGFVDADDGSVLPVYLFPQFDAFGPGFFREDV